MFSLEEGTILVVWPEYPPATGGIQVHGVEFAKFLHRRGNPFVLVTSAPQSPEEAADARTFDQQTGFLPLRLLERGNFDQHLDVLRSLSRALKPRAIFLSQAGYAPAFDDHPAIVCRTAGNDILRPWIGPCMIGSKALRGLSIEQKRERLDRNRRWVLEGARQCRAILCNSHWTADRLAELGLNGLEVMPGGVDIAVFQPMETPVARAQLGLSTDPSLRIALMAARQVLKKGIDVAIEAIALLRRPGLELFLVGSGPETEHLKGLCYELEVMDRVKFLGDFPHAFMPKLVAAADLLLAPSRSVYDPSRVAIDHETMCRATCEAAACGIPVIASRICGIPSVVRDGETGLLVRPNDPEALAAAMEQLLEDPGLCRRLGSTARAWAESNLSFDRLNERTLHHLLAEAPTPSLEPVGHLHDVRSPLAG